MLSQSKKINEVAKNDFSEESACNYEQKCLCVLVLDVSGSMNGTPIVELNRWLQEFCKEATDDDVISQRLEVSIITFNDYVTTVQEPALVENFTIPTLEANGESAIINAVNEAIDKVQARKDWYKSIGPLYYRPNIILMTNKKLGNSQDVNNLASRIKADTAAKRYVFCPICVEDVNIPELNKIAGSIPAMSLKEVKFSQFFNHWIGVELNVAYSTEDEKVTLEESNDWTNILI